MAACTPDHSASNLDQQPAARGICVLQEKWVLHIIAVLLDGPRGFNELGRTVGGCNPSTLRDRLTRLETLGLVQRATHDDAQGRPRYRLTAAGEGLREVIDAIHTWTVLHLHSTHAPPAVTRETESASTT